MSYYDFLRNLLELAVNIIIDHVRHQGPISLTFLKNRKPDFAQQNRFFSLSRNEAENCVSLTIYQRNTDPTTPTRLSSKI